MRILNDREKYKELIEYVCLNCDVVSFTKLNYWYDENSRVIPIILRKTNSTEEDIVLKYSENYLESLYEYLCKDEEIFDESYKKRHERINFRKKSQNAREKERRRFIFIREVIKSIIYDYNTAKWLRKYKERIVLKRKIDEGIEYFIRLNDALKKELFEKNSFFDWKFPETLERMSFYKEGKCLLESYSHDLNCALIYLEDEREYEYLKSIGVKFYEKKFRPISKPETKYVNRPELTNSKY